MQALVTYTKDGHKKKARRWLDGRLKFDRNTRDASLFSEDGVPVASGKIPVDFEIVENSDEFVLEAPSILVVIGSFLSSDGAAAGLAANENAPPQGNPSGPRKSFTRPGSSSGPPRRPGAPVPDARPAAPRPAWQPQQRGDGVPAQRPQAAFKPPAQQQQRSAQDVLRLLRGGGAAPAAPAPPPQQQQALAAAPASWNNVDPPAAKRPRVSNPPQAQPLPQQPRPVPLPQQPTSFRPAALPQQQRQQQQQQQPSAARMTSGTGRWEHQRPRGSAGVPVQHQPTTAHARAPPSRAAPPPPAPTLVLSGPPQPGAIYFPSAHECARPQRQVAVPDRFPTAGAYQRAWGASLGEEVTLQVSAAVKDFHSAVVRLPPGADARAIERSMRSAGVKAYHGECELRVWFGNFKKKGGKGGFNGGRRRYQRGRGRYEEDESDEEEEEEEKEEPQKPDTFSVVLKSGLQNGVEYGKGDVWIIGNDPLLQGGAGGGGRPGEARWVALVRNTWFGPSQDGKFEVQFLSARPAGLKKSTKIYALKGPNCHTELSLLDLLSPQSLSALPLLPALLGSVPLAYDPPAPIEPENIPLAAARLNPSPATNSHPFSDEVGSEGSPLPEALPETPEEAAEAIIRRFQLNPEQAQVVRHVAAWAHDRSARGGSAGPAPPICLCFGPFGCGKSTLLVAVLHLIMQLRDIELGAEGQGADGGQQRRRPHGLSGARVLVSAHTNVAVDRVLLSLLDSGRTDFLRVGPLRKVDRRLLPHSLHASESKNAPTAAAELRHMLEEGIRDGSLTVEEELTLRRELEAAEAGGAERQRRRLLKTVPVVGVTCCSALISAMDDLSFDVVVLDESSQVIEPLALAPLLRARARFLVAAGDPRQLPPLIATPSLPAGSRAATAGDDIGTGPQGLSRPLFVRLSALGASPHLLRRQYRSHPAISAIPNSHFYDGRLLDGCTAEQRPSLLSGLPNVVFVDVCGDTKRTKGGSWFNLPEVEMVVRVVERALAAGVDPRKIGVICFFTAQKDEVKKKMKVHVEALQVAAEQAAAARAAARAAAEGRAVWAAKANKSRYIKESSSEDDESGSGGGSEEAEEGGGGGEEQRPAEFSIKNAAAAVQVATVDAFQGAEKDVIILTAAVDSKNTFIGDDARLNVALTRARHNLVVVGNAKALEDSAPAFKVLLSAVKRTPGGYSGGGQLPVGTRPQ